jgi:hypothetical protein
LYPVKTMRYLDWLGSGLTDAEPGNMRQHLVVDRRSSLRARFGVRHAFAGNKTGTQLLKVTNDTATVSSAAASPQNPHNSRFRGIDPQKTHGQNGIIGHSAARLISWLCSLYKLFAQVEGLAAIVFS